jgi:uncharacterized membrane protein
MSEIQGLPAHPLLVHGPVVLIPLLALLSLLLVVKRGWRATLGPWVVLLGIVAVGLTVVAAGSGEELQANVRDTELVRHHAELGSSMRPIAFAQLVALLLLVAPAWAWRRGGPGVLAGMGASRLWSIVGVVLVIVTAALATYWIVQTGHSGAEAVWHNVRMVNPSRD